MGFFFQDQAVGNGAEKQAPKRSSRTITKKELVLPIRVLGTKAGARGCANCPLNKEKATLNHPKMKPTGAASPLIYIIGEAPGKTEDEEGEQFIGKSGELLRGLIPPEFEDKIRWNNVLRCRPPSNRTPTVSEIVACSQYQVEDIERSKPLFILGFGNVPLQWATEQDGITDWRGQIIPVRIGSHVCWYAPMWHPAYVMRAANEERLGKQILETFTRDLDRVFSLIRKGEFDPPYVPQDEELSAGIEIEMSWKVDVVERHLKSLTDKTQCVDIETNGLRPYSKGSKILSIAFGTWERSYAIPIAHREAQWTEWQRKKLWHVILQHLLSKKRFVAHHLKFELEWLSMPFALGREILFDCRWGDTMAQAEVLRTQSLQSKSLNARSIATIGVAEKTLDSLDRARLDSEELTKVLTYNARDVKFTDLIRQSQDVQIKREGLLGAYRTMVNRVPALVIAQQAGVVPNTKFAALKHVELQKGVDAIENKIQSLPEVRKMVEEKGVGFNSGSTTQLATLMRDYLKIEEGWREVGGKKKYSTDEKVLAQIKHPIGAMILEKRSLAKMDGTYVLGLCERGAFKDADCGKLIYDDGLVHTNYNYLLTTTGRLSSSDPNLQNFPKREHKEIRDGIMAPPYHKMAAVDYGQIEARVLAMASGCPTLSKALWDHYDVHMDWAKRLANAFDYVLKPYLKQAKKDEEKAIKLFRSDVKNVWTFPQFYGSSLVPIAQTLGIPLHDLQPHADEFWEMFAAIKKWQKRVLDNYRKKGYVETLTGRRRYEPLSLNEAINSPIQGTASDIVVRAMEDLVRIAYVEDRWQLAPRMNIHDDLTFYLPEETLEIDLEIILRTMCTPNFDFITVPLTVEFSLGDSWGSMIDIATVESTEYAFPKIEAQTQSLAGRDTIHRLAPPVSRPQIPS